MRNSKRWPCKTRSHLIERQPMRGQILDIRGTPLAYQPARQSGLRRPHAHRPVPPKRGARAGPIAGNQRGLHRGAIDPASLGGKRQDQYLPIRRAQAQSASGNLGENPAGHGRACPSALMKQNSKPANGPSTPISAAKAIFPEDDQIRTYPSQRLAAHVVGFVSNDDQQTGLSGIEASFNTNLAGVCGLAENRAGQTAARIGPVPRSGRGAARWPQRGADH